MQLTKELLEKEYTRGISLSALERKLGISRHLLAKAMKDFGISVKSHKGFHQELCAEKPSKEQLLADYETMSFNQVIKKYRVSHEKMTQWFSDYEIEKRNPVVVEAPSRETLEELYLTKEMSPREIGDIFGVSNVTVMNWCRRYSIPLRKIKESVKIAAPLIAQTKIERHGYPHFPPDMDYQSSKAEKEIADFLNSFGFHFCKTRDVLSGNRELDLFDEKAKIAIEYCGCYWHSEIHESKRDFKYHYYKWKECQDQGIDLITIFDVEWHSKKEKIQNFLLARLGIFERRIFARKCKIVEDLPCKEFFNQFHIQGAPVKVDKTYSLVYENEIVGALSIGSHHRQSKEMLLNRLAFRKGVQVVGGASKLISCLQGQEIVTFSDNRWSNGLVYKNAGFVLDKTLNPDYFYYNLKTGEVKSKQSMTKKKLGCPKEKTESEFALELGWSRVWDCGKKRWKLT